MRWLTRQIDLEISRHDSEPGVTLAEPGANIALEMRTYQVWIIFWFPQPS